MDAFRGLGLLPVVHAAVTNNREVYANSNGLRTALIHRAASNRMEISHRYEQAITWLQDCSCDSMVLDSFLPQQMVFLANISE